jgi:RNase P subunit RPR2
MQPSELTPVEGRLRTKCAKCETPFYCGLSLSMRFGMNSGVANCPKCRTFLHIEILEGDAAWTEEFQTYLKRTGKMIPVKE